MVKFYVVVVSDRIFKGEAKDESGVYTVNELRGNGHEVVGYKVIPNNEKFIRETIEECEKLSVEVLLFIGGTGIGPKDITVDVIKGMNVKVIPGFGELFRFLSFQVEGLKAWLSRAEAFIYKGKTLIFTLPGSIRAVTLALKLIILKEINHAIEMMKGKSHWIKKQ